MKIIPKEESSAYPILRQGRYTHVHMNLLKLRPGEKLVIEKGPDWVSKSPPYKLVKGFAKKHGWKLVAGRSHDKKGWTVERVE